MSVLNNSIFVEGLGKLTNADLVEHYNLYEKNQIDDIGNVISIKSGRVIGHIMDYRKMFLADMKTKAKRASYQRDRADYISRIMPGIIEGVLADLHSHYGDIAFINQTQPNVNIKSVGLRVYVICGPSTHRVTFLHDSYPAKQLAQIVPWTNLTFDNRSKMCLLCNGFKSTRDIIRTIDDVIEKLQQHYV